MPVASPPPQRPKTVTKRSYGWSLKGTLHVTETDVVTCLLTCLPSGDPVAYRSLSLSRQHTRFPFHVLSVTHRFWKRFNVVSNLMNLRPRAGTSRFVISVWLATAG